LSASAGQLDFPGGQSCRRMNRLKPPAIPRRGQREWIDAMAVRHDLTVATRNEKDFRHAKTFNPFTSK